MSVIKGFFLFESIYTMNEFLSLWNGGGSSLKWGSWLVRFCWKRFRVVGVMLGLGIFLGRLFEGGNKVCKLLQRWKHHLCFARFMGTVLDCSQLGFEDVWLFMMVHCWNQRGKVFQVCDFFGEVLFKFCLLIS
jgi:hypothetical protein